MEGQRHHRPRILLVDDYRPNLTALEAILGSSEWDLVAADSGEHALRAVLEDRREEIALVILDVAMPAMSGFEVAELLQHRERTRHIPLLFLTGQQTDKAAMHRGYSVGAIDYITKPFDPHALLAKVRLLVELHEYARSLREEVEKLRGGDTAVRTSSDAAAIATRPLRATVPRELPALVFVLSPGGSVDEATGTLARYDGFSSGAQLTAFAHSDDRAALQSAISRATLTGSFEVEARFRDKETAAWRWLLLRGTAERDEHGDLLCWLGVGAEIDAQKRALDENVQLLIREQAARRTALAMLQRAELQADAAEIATTWTRPEALLSRLTRLLLDRIADWCAIDLVRSGSVERVAVIHRDRVWAETAARLERARTLEALAGTALERVVQTGQPELHSGTALELARSIGAEPETVGRLGARSWAIVPLSCANYCGGALTLVCGAGREQLVDADLRVLARIARLIAVTMSLWERDQRRRRAAQLKSRSVALLAERLQRDPRQLARTARLIGSIARIDPELEAGQEQEDGTAALSNMAAELGANAEPPDHPIGVPRGVVQAARLLFERFADELDRPLRLSVLQRGANEPVELVAELPTDAPDALARRLAAHPTDDPREVAYELGEMLLERMGAQVTIRPAAGGLSCVVSVPSIPVVQEPSAFATGSPETSAPAP